jgi:nitroreductase
VKQVEGSVRKAGNRIRITGQLIDAANGTHLWADRFDGALEDVFELQDRVSESVVGIIAPRVELAEIERVRSKPAGNLEFYRSAFDEFYPRERLATETDPSRQRMMASSIYLADHIGVEPPVLVLFCREAPGINPAGYREWTNGASVYPAVQNMLLAARGSGLGGCLTTLHLRHHAAIKALLGIPGAVDIYALVPLGYPRDKFGPLRRRAVEEVTYLDAWGANLPGV